MRVGTTQPPPLAEVGQVEALKEEAVNGVAQEQLGEGVLAVRGIEELVDGLVGQAEQFIAGKGGLVVLELLVDPGLVELAWS